MNICQTLWTGDKYLLEDNFGWLSAQHHIMGWALSSLKLRSFYKTLNLYSDKNGIDLLVGYLGLPYTDVFDDYSSLNCPQQLWALPKLLTYEKQKSPFLHVDGDVFIWEPFQERLMSAALIAQNLEIGTSYYKGLFAPFISQANHLSEDARGLLLSYEIKAYNAGIFGGSDMAFFTGYISKAKKIINENMAFADNINFNIVFEQLLFYTLAMQSGKKVECYHEKTFNDNGYSTDEIANFPLAQKTKYLHLLGPHKKNPVVCDWLSRVLYKESPEVFLKIVKLFKKSHYYYSSKLQEIHPSLETFNKISTFKYTKTAFLIKALKPDSELRSNAQVQEYVDNSDNVLLKELFKYEKQLHRIHNKFKKLDSSVFQKREIEAAYSTCFFLMPNEEKMNVTLYRNPELEIIQSCFDWTNFSFSVDGISGLHSSYSKNIVIGIIPELFFKGYRDVFLDNLSVNIIILAENGITVKGLLTAIEEYFVPGNYDEKQSSLVNLIMSKIEFLITNKILHIR